jgi:hypothetical protein
MARDKQLPMSQKAKNRIKQEKEAKKPLAVGRILIVCEGEKTEPNYFKWWSKQIENIKTTATQSKALASIDVKDDFGDKIQVEGEGDNTKNLVTKAITLRDKEKVNGKIEYKECWCVFDRDSFPAKNYNDAIHMAEAAGFKIAYTNEAFELWYLLHFDYINTGVSRKQYEKMLTERLGKKYKKNDPNMYETLSNHPNTNQQRAIVNAEKLLELYEKDTDYANHNPSTKIHKLVESLNNHVGQFRCQVAPTYCLPYQYVCKKCENKPASDFCLKSK